MFEWLSSMENTKPLALIIFFVTFCAVVLYVLGNKKRSQRLESYKNIPFQEDDEQTSVEKDKDQENG